MKSNGKSSTPIIAAHTKKNNGQKPAPPSNGNSNGRQARVSRVSSKATDKLKSLILERISDGILAFDSEMNCVYVNERAGEILGREPQTLLGKNFWEEDPQSTGTPFADACQRALEMQTIVPFDGYFPASDTWFEGRVYPSKDGLSVLINKQEKRDDRSEKSEEGILEGSQFPAQNPNPVMRFTHDGKLLYANSAAAPLLNVWKEQTESGIPTKLYDLLQVVVKTGSNTEIELENQGRTYACLLVPIPESGYVNLYFNDITERKLAQESVHALIHQTTTGITRTDLDGKFLFVNQAFCEMLGFSDSELIGKTIWEISHTADLAKNKRLFERILTDEEPYQLEKRLVRRNGSTLWVTVGTSPLRDAAGQICAAVSIIVDITRRKRAEESLLDSARHTLYLSSLSDALRPLSSTSQIEIEATRILGMQLKANRVAYAVIQADGTAGIRNNYVDGVADMTGEFNLSEHMSNEMLMKFRAGRTMITSDAGSIPKNSEPLAVTQEATSLRTQVVIPLIRDGELVATLFVQKLQAHDWKNDEIHLMEETAERMQTAMERARAERDLRESEKRFRILSNTVPSMVWSTTPDGTIQYLNEHWHNYTGLTTEESILHWSELLLHPDDYEQCMAAWNHALKTVPDEYVNEVRYRRYDGEYRWFQSRAIAARDENGNVTAWYGVTTDIHDRMQKQQELQEIINRTPFMLTHGSRDLRYKFVSRAYAEMIGRTPEEVAGKPIIEVVGEQAFNIIAPYIEQVLQGKRVEYEVEIPFERGGTPSLHIVYVPDYDEQGKVVGWFGSMTNVTERKRSERAMIKFARQQTALYHLTDQLHTADTLADIFDSSLQAMLSALQCDRASILLFDASQKIRFVAWHGLSDEYRKATDGHSPWKYGEKNPKPIYYDTIDASDLSDALKAVIAKEGIHSLAFIPLISNGTLIGKFMVYFNTPHTFSESELDLGQTIARQLAAGVDRKQAEESLRVSEEKYRRIVETANEGVWEIDKDTRTLFVNSLMAEMLGYTAEEMIGRSVFEFLLSEDLSEAKRKLEHAKHGGSARAAEFRYRRKDNSVVWLVATNTPKLDEQGNFLGAFAMMSDVTERKQAEEALRQSEERFSRFMEHLPGLAWIKDVEGRYVYANAAAEKAFNTPQDKLYGKTDQEVFPPEIASQFERNDEQALIEGNGVHVMEMLEQQDGILHHSLVTKFPIPGLDGKTILIGGTAFDITERIQMEDALRQARKQAEETADRMARLQEVTASLAGSTIPAQLAELILEQGTRAAGAVTGILVEALTNGQELKTIAALGYPEGTVRTQPLPLSESTPMSDCIRTRRAVWIRSQEEFAAQYPPFAEAGRDIGIQAVVALPLIVGDRTLGGLAFSFAEQHEFLLEERGFFLAVAQQCAQGLERARAEEARRESEERYRAIINQATAGIVRKDANGKLLFVNQAFCDMLGYSAQELTDKTMWQLTHEDDVTENQRLFNRLMVEGIPFQLEKRLIRRNGLILWVTVSVSPVLDAAGKPHSAVSVYADITERKQAEEKLAMELADTKQLQTISSQLIQEDNINVLYEQILDATMAVMRSDMGSIQMLYPDKNELLLLVSKGLDPASAAFWEWVRSDSGSTCGVALRTGERVIVSDVETCDFIAGTADLDFYRLSKIKAVQSTPLVSRSGRIVGMISNHWLVRHQPSERDLRLLDVLARQAADLIERKQAEEALHQSKERYRNLFDLVPVAVYSCDSQGRIQEYNRSAIELWGREPHRNDPDEKYCGSFKIYYPDGRFMPHKKCPMARMLRGETLEPEELEFLVERRDGSRRNVVAHPLPLKNVRGEMIGAINCLYDMTERKQAEERFALLAEISELTREIEEPSEVMSAVSLAVGKHLHVRRCLFNEIDLENDIEIVHHDYHDGIPSVEGVHKISDYSSITSMEIAAGKTIVNYDSKTDPRTANDYERSYLPNGERAYVAVPLMRDERWVASLWVSDDAPREWSKAEVSLLETIAERTWTATEKLRINAALRDSEERLRVTFNTTAVGVATLELDTRFVEVNDAFCRIVGYSREELLGMDYDALTHPDYIDSMREQVAQLIAGDVPSFVVEKLYVRKDGAQIWVQNSASLLRDADGKPLHLITICQDITERKRTEDALHQLNLQLESRVQRRTAELEAANEFLRESEATSQLILESMPDAIIIADKDGQIVYANTQVKNMFGYSPQEVIEQPVEILIPQRFHEKHVGHRRDYSEQREKRFMGLTRDMFGQRKDQSEFPVDVMLSPISNNTTWDVMITIRDNTEQKQAQQALRTNEEKLRKLFEILPVGISFLDNEGHITEMNSALTQILGLSKRELLEGKFEQRRYIRTDGTPMTPSEFANVRAHAEQKTIYNVETGIIKENGETIWTSVNAAPVDVADVDIVVATIDITERKKAEEALHKNRERLRTLSRRLVEVQEEERRALARELHDRVGQNLAALNLNLNILRGQLSTEALQIIGSRLDDSVSLVNQILTITRNVMSDLRSNVLDDYGLESALREFADQFTLRTGIQVVTDKSVNLIPHLDSGIEMTLLRIAQEALTNVARHAQANQATISMSADGENVYMSIQDDGVGILSWQRANQPGSHGLRIIRERAEAFGGSLQIHSTYKKGTRLDVKIPLVSENLYKVPREKRS